jgi:ABC-2 type transport system permease protein
MGASVSQILPEIRYLWIQAAAYLGMACLVYRYQFRLKRKAAGRRALLGNKYAGR